MANDYSAMLTHRHDTVNITLGAKFPIREWTVGVPVEDHARKQLFNVANLPFIHKHVAAMPDIHVGHGTTVGSVIATDKALIPGAAGVDLGCGMDAVMLTLKASHLPDDLSRLRSIIESMVPHGRTDEGGPNDEGAWGDIPASVSIAWSEMETGYEKIVQKNPRLRHRAVLSQLGTLGSGNHFIEICLDTEENVWIMLHSGSRGPGNRVGTYFINLAKQDMKRWFINVPDADLSYLPEGSEHFDNYVEAVGWCQEYARQNRALMMGQVLKALKNSKLVPKFEATQMAVSCHHNYVAREFHFGKSVWVTRKGAVSARKGQLGIIPGSMGAKSFIVRGLGNPDSFHSCSHGAGRKMSRTEAKNTFTLKDLREDTQGVECKKEGSGILEEIPRAYKNIDDVMKAQSDLVEVVHTLKQILVVKGED